MPLPLHMCPQVDEVLSTGSVTRFIVTPRQGARYQHATYVLVRVCFQRVSGVFFCGRVDAHLPKARHGRCIVSASFSSGYHTD
jgi:hypothetical protein